MTGNSAATVQAREIMASKKLISLNPKMEVFKAIGILIKNKISGAPVVDEAGKLLGVFSEKSVMQVLIDAAYEGLPSNTVEAFMDRSPHTISENTQLLSIAQIFLTTPRRRLPVLRDGKLVGQVSRRDVVKAVFEINKLHETHEKTLLYLSALKGMDEAPSV